MPNPRRRLLGVVAVLCAVVTSALVPVAAQASGQYPTGRTGIDISYPSCSRVIAPGVPFGIVGVNGGRPYSDNPCAAAEAHAFTNVSLYVNTGLYTGGSFFAKAMAYGGCAAKDRSCGAYWYGYLAGLEAYRYAKAQGLAGAATWWLDVEVMNDWSTSTALNDRSILGEHQAIADLTPATGTRPRAVIGVYARAGEWSTITGGGLATRHWPVWLATGLTKQTTTQLARFCTKSFTASKVQIVQWIGPGTLNDLDYGC
ncbi:MAG TPA: hypothetical protein VGC94_02520 [Amnibacterium sp.]